MLSSTLNDRIKQGTRALKLSWTSYLYIDMSTVLHHVMQYSHVLDLCFEAQHRPKPHWGPIDWSLIPSTLTSLSLFFAGSISSLLNEDLDISIILPNLTSLRAVEENNGRRHRRNYRVLRLHRLPPHLLTLHLCSQRTFIALYSDFSELPTGLETLILNLILDITRTDLNVKMHLPPLPPRLKKLLFDRFSSHIHLDLKQLPQSLQSLQVSCSIAVDSSATGVSSLVGSSTDLPLLQDFFFPSLLITPAQVSAVVPASASRLLFEFDGIQDFDTDDLIALAPIVSKLIGYQGSRTYIPLLCAIAQGFLPSSTMQFIVVGGQYALPTILPSSETTGLREFLCNDATVTAELFNSKLSLTHLTTLRIEKYDIPIERLCNLLSLESLEAPLSAYGLAQVFESMRTSSLPPKLKSITSRTLIPDELLEAIPPQLEALDLHMETHGSGISDHLRDIIQSASHIKSLSLRMAPNHKAKAAATLIKALPKNLTQFSFFGNVALQNDWQVGFPASLTSLSWIGPVVQRHNAEQSTPLVFPPMLQALRMPTTGLSTTDDLPRYLSDYDSSFEIDGTYFKARRHPNPALSNARLDC